MEAVEEKMHVYGLYTYLHWGNGCDALMLEATAGLNKLLISKFLEHALPIYMSTLRATCRATGVIYFVNNAISRCGE